MNTIIRICCMIICTGLAASCAAPTGKPIDSGEVSGSQRAPVDATSTNSGAVAGSQKASFASASVFPELGVWLAKNRLVINVGQSEAVEYDKAFSQGAVVAYGEGYPVAGAEGAAKKRLTAVRAAEVVAQRNLAEYFSRYATNGEIRFSSYNTHLEAFLKGAHVAVSEYNADLGKAAVLLRLDLGGAKGFAK